MPSFDALPPRLADQARFLVEMDKLKGVLRRTSPIGQDRRENSAEHSWQVVLLAITLAEHSAEPIDLLRVLKLLAIHDAVEIDVGDTFHYAKASDPDLAAKEHAAAVRVFGLLPEDQAAEFLALWEEFEAKQTPESRFAAAVDRVVAFLMNAHTHGGTWAEYRLSAEQVRAKNQDIPRGAPAIWDLAEVLVQFGLEKGYLS